jgi:hypothetical protein
MSAQHVPTVRYHPSEPPRSVETAEELEALGPVWQDHPYTPEEVAAWEAAQAQLKGEGDTPKDEGDTPTPRSRR